MRDINAAMIVEFARRECGVQATRNRAARHRAARGIPTRPSGCSLAAAALARHGYRLDEGTIQEHIWKGMAGELVREVIGTPWRAPRQDSDPGAVNEASELSPRKLVL
jgi:hypothetical protein